MSNARNARAELGSLSFEHPYESLKEATADFADGNKLGSGSFGAVYKGTLHDGTPVAIKRIDLEKAAAIGLQGGGFVDEVKSLSRLRHKNLVTMMGWSIQNHYRLIVYELLPGGDLQSRLAGVHTNPFPWLDRVSVLIDAASGLNYMHTRSPKHFHRDIKPANVLLDKNGQGKLADFGLAMLQNTMEQETTVKVIAGSEGYMDPHHLTSGKITEANEVYSFGVIILVVLTNKSPEDIFAHVGNMIATEVNRVLTLVDATAEWPKSISKNIAALALLCMSQDAKERPTFGQILYIIKQMKKKKNTKKASAPHASASLSTSQPSQPVNPQVAEKLVAMAPAGLTLGASPLSVLKPTPVRVLSSGTPPRSRLNPVHSLGPRRISRPTMLPELPKKTVDGGRRRRTEDLDETVYVAPPTSLPSRKSSRSSGSSENSNVHNPSGGKRCRSQSEQDGSVDETPNSGETVCLEEPVDLLPSCLPSVPAAGEYRTGSPKSAQSITSSRPRSPLPTLEAASTDPEKRRSRQRDSRSEDASASSEKRVRRVSHARVRDAVSLEDQLRTPGASANPSDTNLAPNSRSVYCRTVEDTSSATPSPSGGVHVDNSTRDKNPFDSDIADANFVSDEKNLFANDIADANPACDGKNPFANDSVDANPACDGTNPVDDELKNAEKEVAKMSASETTARTLHPSHDRVPTPQRKIRSGGEITQTRTPSTSSSNTDVTFSEDGPKPPSSIDNSFHVLNRDNKSEHPREDEVDPDGARGSHGVTTTTDVSKTDFHDTYDASKALADLVLPARLGSRQAISTSCEVCFTIFASQLPATACDNCRL